MPAESNRTPYQCEVYDIQIRRGMPYYEAMHQEIINLAFCLDRPPELWLDTGCGTGTLVRRAVDALPRTRFMLTDPFPGMLDLAKEKLKGQDRVRFLPPLHTHELLGKADERPDTITASLCHHYMSCEGRAEAVRVCYELLPPGGTFIAFENVRPSTPEGFEIGKRCWARFWTHNGKSAAETEDFLARLDVECLPITVEEHLDLLRSTGFRAVELFWRSVMQAGFYAIK